MNAEESKHGRNFETLVIWVATLSMAAAAGLMASIKQINPAVEFRFSIIAAIACAVAGAVTYWLSRLLLRGHGHPRRKVLLLVIAALAVLPSYVLFALQSVSAEKRLDFAIGAGSAVVVLTLVGWLAWRVMRFLESEDNRNQESHHRDSEDTGEGN